MVMANKRREKDVMKLLVSEYEVEMSSDNSTSEFHVKFCGPKESPYEGVSDVTMLEANIITKPRNIPLIMNN